MAKKCLKIRNDKRKKISLLHKTKRDGLIKIAKDLNAAFEDRFSAQVKLAQMPRDGSKSRYRNRCSLTSRPRGNLRKFGLSRIAVRDLALCGQIPGLIKASW